MEMVKKKNKGSEKLLTSLTGKLKRFFIEHLVLILLLLILAIYLSYESGLNYTVNYIAIVLAIFVPLFIPVYIYSIIKSVLLKVKVEKKEVILCLIFVAFTTVIYIFGLHEKQRIFLGVFNGILSFFIIIVMFVKTIFR